MTSAFTSNSDAPTTAAEGSGHGSTFAKRAAKGRRRATRTEIAMWQIAIVAGAVLGWEYLPQQEAFRERSAVFDPFFVSSPSRIWDRVIDMATGTESRRSVWSPLFSTLQGAFLGVAAGMILGAAAGLVLSNSDRLNRIFAPFIAFFNAAPRIAFIPIFVIILGPSLQTSVLTALLVVFFIAFYNAHSGGSSVSHELIDNARLLGATDREIMVQIRLRYVLVWTAAALPNAISFGLVAVVTAEILTGQAGMGRLLFDSISVVDSTQTFAVVLILSVVGAAIVVAADRLQRRALHWWQRS